MEFKCTPLKHNCQAKCCKDMTILANIEDINRWIDEERTEILSCLSWLFTKETKNVHLLFIPKKKHLREHNFLNRFYKKKWEKSNVCIFLRSNRCQIYKTRPTACRDFPMGNLKYSCPSIKDVTEKDKKTELEMHKERKADNLAIFHKRELVSKLINKSKEEADLKKLAKILGMEGKS